MCFACISQPARLRGVILWLWFFLPLSGIADEGTLRREKVVNLLKGNLVKLQGTQLVNYELSAELVPEYFLFYYSAGWNPMCRKHTPSIVNFYKSNDLKDKMEFIMVSFDDDEKSMQAYARQFGVSFPVVRINAHDKIGPILNLNKGRGLPSLVVLDKNGEVYAESYVKGKYKTPAIMLAELDSLLKKKNGSDIEKDAGSSAEEAAVAESTKK